MFKICLKKGHTLKYLITLSMSYIFKFFHPTLIIHTLLEFTYIPFKKSENIFSYGFYCNFKNAKINSNFFGSKYVKLDRCRITNVIFLIFIKIQCAAYLIFNVRCKN